MPNIGSTFRTDEPFLHKILEEVGDGIMQLPDFQRGWVWDDEHIRSLIASVSLSYPIGAIMTLETGGDGGRFAPKPVQGTSFPAGKLPEKLILDGQQRRTIFASAWMSMQDAILRSHRINPNVLRADDFLGFLRHRAAELLDIIQAATGKTVSGRDSDEVVEAFGGSLVPEAETRP